MNVKDNNRLVYAAELRKVSEEIARKEALALPKSISPNTQKIIQELHVHQIELEMQNEELRRSQVRLDAERERYFDFYNLATVGYLTISEQGLILEANLTTATLLGSNRAELDKQPISQFIFKEDQDSYYLHRKQLFDNGGPQVLELRMLKKDGTAFWAILRTTSSQDVNGNPEYHVVLSNITDRKRAETAQETNRLRLAGIIEATNVGTWEWNVQTGETVFSERWAQILGYTLSELEPVSIKTWQKFAFPDDLKQSWKQLELHFAGELPYYDCECQMKHKDGHCVWVHDRGRVVTRTADGKPLLVLGTHSDITGRKQAEEKITMLAQAVENTAECIGITDKDYNLVFVNRAFLPIYGYTQDELIGRPVAIIHSENNATKVSNNLFSTLAKNQTWKGEVLNKRKDGSDFTVLLTLSPLLNEKGELVGSVGITKDITELKLAEDEIKLKNEELHKANAEKDKFFSIIAHDLRSPFQGFLGLTQEMAEKLPRLTKPEMQEIAANTRDSATNLFRLIESLLQWARMQQGLIPFKPKAVLLLPIVNESLAMVLELVSLGVIP